MEDPDSHYVYLVYKVGLVTAINGVRASLRVVSPQLPSDFRPFIGGPISLHAAEGHNTIASPKALLEWNKKARNQ